LPRNLADWSKQAERLEAKKKKKM